MMDVPLERLSVPLNGSRSNAGRDYVPHGAFLLRLATAPEANGLTALTSGTDCRLWRGGRDDGLLAQSFLPLRNSRVPYLGVSYLVLPVEDATDRIQPVNGAGSRCSQFEARR
jgi:hypothetical protein